MFMPAMHLLDNVAFAVVALAGGLLAAEGIIHLQARHAGVDRHITGGRTGSDPPITCGFSIRSRKALLSPLLRRVRCVRPFRRRVTAACRVHTVSCQEPRNQALDRALGRVGGEPPALT
jgi:hypothetical protein